MQELELNIQYSSDTAGGQASIKLYLLIVNTANVIYANKNLSKQLIEQTPGTKSQWFVPACFSRPQFLFINFQKAPTVNILCF